MKEIYLYTTSGCHLCEQAQALLLPVLINVCALNGLPLDALRISAVEISDDIVLVERYGVRIPVIKLAGTDDELDWPFNQEQAFEFLNTQLSRL